MADFLAEVSNHSPLTNGLLVGDDIPLEAYLVVRNPVKLIRSIALTTHYQADRCLAYRKKAGGEH